MEDAPANKSVPIVDTQLLIVGAGPAGASLACFLSHPPYSMTGILISATSTTSQTPRAHITNAAALECLRDVGLEESCIAHATTGDCMMHTRWCHDMTGQEYARIYSWGNDPKRRADYQAASPCSHVDLPQTEFEPILTRRAAEEGWGLRFNTSFMEFRIEDDGGVLSRLRDDLTGQEYRVRSRYLFGCDGARSSVLRQAGIPLIKKPGQGLAMNVLVEVDLAEFVEARKGNLHWVFQPEREYPEFAWAGLVRMVKPWSRWMFIFFPKPLYEWREPTHEQWVQRCKEVVGRDDTPLKILDVSRWNINEIIAEYYSDANELNRHPPFNGLGSNTCVQDAFNLAWKIKYVSHNLAAPSLLDSFSKERQPVGLGVVTRANQGIRDHIPVWNAMGLTLPTVAERMAFFATLAQPTELGRRRRLALSAAIEGTSQEFHGLGVEMNHYYESKAIYSEDESVASRRKPEWSSNPTLEHRATTFPGHRLPHAWLNRRMPGKRRVSTVDLAGHGVFCLLTGIGGEGWKRAAQGVGAELGVRITAWGIGWGQDYEDVYRDWEVRREVEEDGVVLVRPDRFVCWRAMRADGDCEARLRKVMKCVLGR